MPADPRWLAVVNAAAAWQPPEGIDHTIMTHPATGNLRISLLRLGDGLVGTYEWDLETGTGAHLLGPALDLAARMVLELGGGAAVTEPGRCTCPRCNPSPELAAAGARFEAGMKELGGDGCERPK
jgi:hypothetical protein